MKAISRPLSETATHRRTRHLAYFRRVADLALRAAEIAAEQLERDHPTGEPGATAVSISPTPLAPEATPLQNSPSR